jgi:hypothetical protein
MVHLAGGRGLAAPAGPPALARRSGTIADLSTERIKRQAVLGGLINEYERAALKPSSEPVAHL